MKSQINLKRVGSCIWFVIVVAIALSGCKTVSGGRSIPVTDVIINTIRVKPDAREVYYYVSKTVTARFTSSGLESSIVNHEIHWDLTDINRTIRITPQTPGVINGEFSATSLEILFKTDQGDTVLTFSKSGTGPAERYILASVTKWSITTSNGEITNTSGFDVSYRNQSEPPSLLVISQENVINR